ncbi:MAG: MEKHLA domain-containing protein [Methylococcales bacterium]|nr:MAG: MEKHLA domain-containing protein [Methylococcales bacterium]
MDYPSETNNYLVEHAKLIRHSYSHWLLDELIPQSKSELDFAKRLFEADFALVTHNTEAEPVFNYANQKALDLFEFNWQDFTRLASKHSAEPVNQSERERLLTLVTKNGYIDDYEGIRVSSTGKRFVIRNAIVWNLVDENQVYQGQAACFDQWSYL